MDPIENAIRNAFAKGNAEDRAFREKVYRSAFAALDRALQANPSITVENAIKRRKAMQARIAEIESEFLPAAPAVSPERQGGRSAPSVEAPSSDTPSPDAPSPDAPSLDVPALDVSSKPSAPALDIAARREPSMDGGQVEPPLSAPSRSSVAPEPVPEPVLAGSPSAEPSVAGVEVAPDRDERRAARRRVPYGALLMGLLLLAVVGGGVWWAARSGFLKAPLPTNGNSGPVEGAASSNGLSEPARPGVADQNRNWITVFTPSDPTLVSAPSDASADVMQDDSGAFLRIRSGASGSAISFDVGQGVLERLAGKHAVFDILARAEEGKEAQMAVDCNFGDFGNCGRRRYAVGHERNEYLFDVEFPDKQPGSAGTIAVNSDFDGQGRSVDIYEIRVSVAE